MGSSSRSNSMENVARSPDSPGADDLRALDADLEYSASATFAVIVVFYMVMFTLVEVPAACFAIAPERTKLRVSALNTWLDENRTAVVVWTLMVFGIFELVHGVVVALE